MNNKPILYILMEIKARELEARSLLAFEAATRGFRVVLGNQNHINWGLRNDALPPGIYYDKSLTRSKEKKLKRIVEKGCLLASQDEENGLLNKSYDKFLSFRSSPETVNLADSIFCWGEHDYEAWTRHYPDFVERIHLTGSPRIDFWRPDFKNYFQERVNSIKQKFGKFVLVVSNFGANGYKSLEKIIQQGKRNGKIISLEDENNARKLFEEDKKMFKHFVFLVNYLAEKHKDINFIVRPHPVEKVSEWEKSLYSQKNISIISKDSISSWIRASEAVLHNGCTTGIEAYVTSVPVVSYVPFTSERNREIPNKLSINCNTEKEVSNVLSQIIQRNLNNDKYRTKEKDKIIQSRLLNVNGDTAAKRIADELGRLNAPLGFQIKTSIKAKKWALKNNVKNFLSIKLGRVNKFPGGLKLFELQQIQKDLIFCTDKYKDCSIKHLYGDVFVIEKI